MSTPDESGKTTVGENSTDGEGSLSAPAHVATTQPPGGTTDAVLRAVLRSAAQGERLDPFTAEEVSDRKSDRRLKERYANWFIGILIGQLALMNLVLIGSGLGWLSFADWVLQLYMGGTLLEVFGVVFVITNHLFPKRGPGE